MRLTHRSPGARALIAAVAVCVLAIAVGSGALLEKDAADANSESVLPVRPPDRTEPPISGELAPVEPGAGERLNRASQLASTPSDTAAAFELDNTNMLRGRVVVDGPVPADEVMEVVVGAYRPPPGSGESDVTGALMLDFFAPQFVEVASVRVAPDGRFRAPRVLGATVMTLHVRGDYVSGGTLRFDVGGDDDPGESPVELAARLGAHVTLVLRFPSDATETEKQSLVGRPFQLSGSAPFTSGQPGEFDLEVGPGGLVIARSLPDWRFRYDRQHRRSEPSTSGLAPFTVPWEFGITVAAGERRRIDVPLARGMSLRGVVRESDGSTLAGADVRIRCSYDAASGSGSSSFFSRSASDGTFDFRGLPDGIELMTATAPGRLSVVIERAEIDKLLKVPEDIEIVMLDGLSIRVRVTVPDGRPVRGLRVAMQFSNVPGSISSGYVTTDETGLLVIPCQSESARDVTASGWWDAASGGAESVTLSHAAPDGAVRPERVTLAETLIPRHLTDASPIELVMTAAPVLRGRVVGLAGRRSLTARSTPSRQSGFAHDSRWRGGGWLRLDAVASMSIPSTGRSSWRVSTRVHSPSGRRWDAGGRHGSRSLWTSSFRSRANPSSSSSSARATWAERSGLRRVRPLRE